MLHFHQYIQGRVQDFSQWGGGGGVDDVGLIGGYSPLY